MRSTGLQGLPGPDARGGQSGLKVLKCLFDFSPQIFPQVAIKFILKNIQSVTHSIAP